MNDAPRSEPRRDDRRAARRRRIEGVVIVAFWSTLAALDVARRASDPFAGARASLSEGEILYTFLEYGLWVLATPLIFWLTSRFSLERRDWLRLLVLHVVVAVSVSAAADLVSHVLWNTIGVGRPRAVSLGAVLGGFHILPEILLYLVVLAAGFARAYFLRYRERVEEAARLRAEAAELQAQLADARLHALRSQLNPHF
ncbi:MAG: histidine kinase, partial [Rhodothermales bacterium]|nr:histidine kinase [Rhodothermales bacterium]